MTWLARGQFGNNDIGLQNASHWEPKRAQGGWAIDKPNPYETYGYYSKDKVSGPLLRRNLGVEHIEDQLPYVEGAADMRQIATKGCTCTRRMYAMQGGKGVYQSCFLPMQILELIPSLGDRGGWDGNKLSQPTLEFQGSGKDLQLHPCQNQFQGLYVEELKISHAISAKRNEVNDVMIKKSDRMSDV